jgi:hypothetical protein
MFRKLRLVLLLAALIAVGSTSGGVGQFISYAFGVYVLWRAAPAVLADFRGLWSVAGSGLRGRFRAGSRPNSTL